MNWNINKRKHQDGAFIEVSVVLNPRMKAAYKIIGINQLDARQHLEENGFSPGECLTPTALAGNLDNKNLTAAWTFVDTSVRVSKPRPKAKSSTKTTRPTTKTPTTSKKES